MHPECYVNISYYYPFGLNRTVSSFRKAFPVYTVEDIPSLQLPLGYSPSREPVCVLQSNSYFIIMCLFTLACKLHEAGTQLLLLTQFPQHPAQGLVYSRAQERGVE